MNVNQIQEGIKKDPNHVDKVPIQAADFHGIVIFRRVLAPVSLYEDHTDDCDANGQVNCVNAGHHEIEKEKNLRLLGMLAVPRKVQSGDLLMDPVIVVFVTFDRQEGNAQYDCQQK